MHLTFKDVWLGYFITRQNMISQLVSGDELMVNGDEGLYLNGRSVLKFSKKFVGQIDLLRNRNYELKRAKVNFIVYWYDEATDQEYKIILPELYFEKQSMKVD